jgi:L-amino acid N-acyltransferase YncA
LLIRELTETDWPSVKRIFEQGIATGSATFETEAPSWPEWDEAHLAEMRLVAEDAGAVVGWAALTPVSSRECYRGVAEESVYVEERSRGRGIGRALLTALLERADAAGIWTVQTSIFPENVASIELHCRCGFRVVGTRERIGQLRGVWRDTALLERRVAWAG